MAERLYRTLYLLFVMAMVVWFMTFLQRAHAHEHEPGETSEQAQIVKFYSTWKRPKGDYSVEHRNNSCCFAAGGNQDCFPVLAIRRNAKGELEVTPDVTGTATSVQTEYGGKWYTLNHNIEEDKQPDPRESPDGRSHVCVTSTDAICYVPGYGN